MRYKKIRLISMIMAMLMLAVYQPAQGETAPAAGEEMVCCGTDPTLSQERYNALVQKKLAQLNNGQTPPSNGSMTRQAGFSRSDPEMPSTGDVKALVVPIEFQDVHFTNNIREWLESIYFSKKDLSNSELKSKNLSLSDCLQKASFNKLRVSGLVLPVHTASEKKHIIQAWRKTAIRVKRLKCKKQLWKTKTS